MFFPILSNAALLTSCTPRLKPAAKCLLITVNVHSRFTHYGYRAKLLLITVNVHSRLAH